ncbi:TIGR04255 family protein [Streptomyces tirandamycinicus]|uniref:TIGR04255 family protein n=1 Tax=Streptomyces tirandamycinicus TaxID=2174846 RepID=UPI0034418A85
MGHREIYPNPPLALTIVELRHTATPSLTDADQASLKSCLAGAFPLYRPARQVNVTMTNAGVTQDQRLHPRYMARDNAASITYRTDAIVVETTRYERRSALRELLRQAVEARQKIAPVDGIERLGTRYINEVRAPGIESPSDWTKWITAPLTSITDLKTANESSPQSWQGMAVFGTTSAGIVLRHGIFEGYAVEPAGDLRRPTPPPGPFYLVDLDCYWAPDGETPPLDWDLIEPRFNDAGLAAYELFEQLITDEYRKEVLRRDR